MLRPAWSSQASSAALMDVEIWCSTVSTHAFPQVVGFFDDTLKVMNDKTSGMQGSIRDPTQFSYCIEGYCLWNPLSVFTSNTVT